MEYFELITRQNPEKIAIITESKQYSYGDLAKKIISMRNCLDKSNRVYFIHKNTIIDQLCYFMAYSGTKIIPVIATKISKNQDFVIENIPDTACMGVMTSGSTGKSKLLWRSFSSWADFFPEQNKIFGLNEESVMFCQGSLAFTGNLNMYMSVLYLGATLVVTDKFTPKLWIEMIKNYEVNAIYMIPSKLQLLPKCSIEINKNIKSIITGSQSMGRKEAQYLKSIYPNAVITLYYGASELNYITYVQDGDMTEDKTLIGKAFNGVKISIDNKQILVDTPFGIEGIKMPFCLNDRGYLDKEDRLHFLGRSDDILNVNGIKVSRYKIESYLQQFLGIDEIAVIIRSRKNVDLLIACVTEDFNYKKSEIIERLKEHLSEYEIPKRFIKFNKLPKNESGKLDRRALDKMIP